MHRAEFLQITATKSAEDMVSDRWGLATQRTKRADTTAKEEFEQVRLDTHPDSLYISKSRSARLQ
eukprot:COSAG05_NODE_4894_length_1334_cov_1.290688_2_plen_65_part_00